MMLRASELIRHLSRLYSGGLIHDLVLRGWFSTTAITEDNTLLVYHPGLRQGNPLVREAGVPDLRGMIHRLRKHASADDEVFIRRRDPVEGEGWIVAVGEERWDDLLVPDPTAIRSYIDPLLSAEIRAEVEEAAGESRPLTGMAVETVLEAERAVRPEYIFFRFAPEDPVIVVGQEARGSATVPAPELRSQEPFELVFSAPLVRGVLGCLGDFTAAALQPTTPNGPLRITEGAYEWHLMPLEP